MSFARAPDGIKQQPRGLIDCAGPSEGGTGMKFFWSDRSEVSGKSGIMPSEKDAVDSVAGCCDGYFMK